MTDIALTIAKLRDLLSKATPGPWIANGEGESEAQVSTLDPYLLNTEEDSVAESVMRGYDAAFVAFARNSLSEILDELDRLHAALPDGMKHCTILFKECAKGHGWLTATNWVQHGCPTCEISRREEMLRAADDLIEAGKAALTAKPSQEKAAAYNTALAEYRLLRGTQP